MPWYGWLGWILMLAAIVGILIYFLVRKKQPANLAEAKLRLREMEDELRKAKAKAVEEAVARKKAEAAKAATEMKLLEATHKEQLEALKGKEKEDYEKAKQDPSSGVDYMRDLLGIGPGNSPSGPGPE